MYSNATSFNEHGVCQSAAFNNKDSIDIKQYFKVEKTFI